MPIDDENTTAFAWAIFGDRADPEEYNTPEGPELIEQGELMDRSYDQRQRFPGDAEAVEGMGRIADQKDGTPGAERQGHYPVPQETA